MAARFANIRRATKPFLTRSTWPWTGARGPSPSRLTPARCSP